MYAGTNASAITVKTLSNSLLRVSRLAYCKAYNVVKEQFATNLKGYFLFKNLLFKAAVYLEEFLQRLADRKTTKALINIY